MALGTNLRRADRKWRGFLGEHWSKHPHDQNSRKITFLNHQILSATIVPYRRVYSRDPHLLRGEDAGLTPATPVRYISVDVIAISDTTLKEVHISLLEEARISICNGRRSGIRHRMGRGRFGEVR